MRKSFFSKAIFAVGVMASALALSSVAVFAADYTLDFGDSSVQTALSVSNGKTGNSNSATFSNLGTNNYYELYLSGKNRTYDTEAGYIQFGSANDAINFTTSKANAEVTIGVASNGTTERTINLGTNATDTSTNVTVNSTTKVTKTFTLGAAGNYSIKCQNARFYTVTVSENDNTNLLDVVATNTDSYAGTFTFDPVAIDKTATVESVTISYSGDDYYLEDQEIDFNDLTEGTESYTFDVSNLNPQPTLITYTVVATGKSGATGTFTSTPATGNYSTEYIVTYTGEDYTMDSQTVKATDSNVTLSGTGANRTLTVDLSNKMTSTQIVTFADGIGASNFATSTKTYGKSVKLSSNKKIAATPKNNEALAIESRSKSYTMANGANLNTVTTSDIKFGGGVQSSGAASVTFKTTGTTSDEGKIYIYAESTSSGNARTLRLYSNGTYVDSTTTADGVSEITFDVKGGTTYNLGSASSGIRIYYIGIKDLSFDTLNPSDTIRAISGADYYAVDDTNTYIIHGLTADDLTYDTLTLSVPNGEDIVTDEVYTSVELASGNVVTAGDGVFEDYVALYPVLVDSVDNTMYNATLTWSLAMEE